jgi:hypothetical protein
MYTIPKRTCLLMAVLLAFLLQGCASLRLYSEGRDKQGQTAQKAWSEVDLNAVVETERANLRKLLDAELDTQDRLAAGIRDHELRYMVASKLKDGLVNPVGKRFTGLAGDDEKFRKSRNALQIFRKRQLQVAALQPDFDEKNLGTPSCSLVAGGDEPSVFKQLFSSGDETSKAEGNALLKRLRDICGKVENDSDLVSTVYAELGGEMRLILDTYRDDVAELEAAKAVAKPLIDEYQKARQAYEDAQKQKSSDLAQKVKEAAKTLKDKADILAGAQDAFSTKFIAEEKLESLENFVKAVTETPSDGKPPEGANRATLAFILIPDLVDNAIKSLEDAKRPLALPLLIRRNYEQLRLEAANREIASREAKVKLSREMLDVAYEQALQLWLANNVLNHILIGHPDTPDIMPNEMPDVRPFHDAQFLDAVNKTNPDERELIYDAAARYLDSVNRLTAKRYKLEYKRVATIHELSLAYAEVNMKQWSALIGAVVGQIAEASALGIKEESVTNLLNMLGIFWIGHGVNK